MAELETLMEQWPAEMEAVLENCHLGRSFDGVAIQARLAYLLRPLLFALPSGTRVCHRHSSPPGIFFGLSCGPLLKEVGS